MLLSGFGALSAGILNGSPVPGTEAYTFYPGEQMPLSVGPVDNLAPLLFVQIMVSVFGIIGGVGLLRRRVWARGLIELLSWVLMATVIAMSVFFAVFKPLGGEGDLLWRAFSVLPILVWLAWTVPIALMIKVLRSEQVVAALKASA